jgi:hypothetical protein
LRGITGYLVPKTGEHWSMGPSFRWIPDVIPTYQNGQTVSNYANLFIHHDIDTDYIAISIRAQLNRFAFALATTRNDEGFSMMATTFLL